jgi:hypothetical protein
MTMDEQLMSAIANYIIPFVPYLVKAGEALAEEAGKKIAGDSWNGIKGIWDKLRPGVDSKVSLKEVVSDLASNPNDDDLKGAFRSQFKKLLLEDPSIAAEIEKLFHVLSQRQSSGKTFIASGAGAVVVEENSGLINTGTITIQNK